MPSNYITLTKNTIAGEHICCAFSDKKCAASYALKKEWLAQQFDKGYIFRRLDERAKVFIEYGPAEHAWLPVDAPGYLMINCFWVSGQYKGKGHGKALLQSALDDAKKQKKHGLVTVVGAKKLPFMGDTKWLLSQGFELCAELPHGFILLVKKLTPNAPSPAFKKCAATGECPDKKGLVAYYTNRCPYSEYYAKTILPETAQKRNLPLKLIKLETAKQAQSAPTPATIFSLFHNGKFITTDISACLDARLGKWLKT
jgi:GNAT superfamily N-acetyltransferase